MPELPEVETIRRQLAPHLEGRRDRAGRALDPRWTAPRPPSETARQLHGAVIDAVTRAGKYLIWELSGDRHLLIHLRMTGTLLVDPAPEPVHTRVRLDLDDGHRWCMSIRGGSGPGISCRAATPVMRTWAAGWDPSH